MALETKKKEKNIGKLANHKKSEFKWAWKSAKSIKALKICAKVCYLIYFYLDDFFVAF